MKLSHLLSKPGLYKIINKANGKVYIGKASSVNGRCHKHLSTLRRGAHHNKYLQRSFDKYGEDSFEVEVIEYSNENLEQKEINLIENTSNTYNLTSGGEGFVGLEFSEEHRKKLSEAHMGQKAWNKGVTPPPDVRKKKMILKTKEQVEEVINRINNGELKKDIAEELGIHVKTLGRTIKRYYGGFYEY
jgi:group I intron endonuclease